MGKITEESLYTMLYWPTAPQTKAFGMIVILNLLAHSNMVNPNQNDRCDTYLWPQSGSTYQNLVRSKEEVLVPDQTEPWFGLFAALKHFFWMVQTSRPMAWSWEVKEVK